MDAIYRTNHARNHARSSKDAAQKAPGLAALYNRHPGGPARQQPGPAARAWPLAREPVKKFAVAYRIPGDELHLSVAPVDRKPLVMVGKQQT